jgi:hypothetical protein
MKSKWYSIFSFLILSGFIFLLMYWIQNHENNLNIKDLEKVVEKELIEFHSR